MTRLVVLFSIVCLIAMHIQVHECKPALIPEDFLRRIWMKNNNLPLDSVEQQDDSMDTDRPKRSCLTYNKSNWMCW